MPLKDVVITLIVVGLGLWLVSHIPMNATIKNILNGVVIVAVVLWLLSVLFGGGGWLGGIHIF